MHANSCCKRSPSWILVSCQTCIPLGRSAHRRQSELEERLKVGQGLHPISFRASTCPKRRGLCNMRRSRYQADQYGLRHGALGSQTIDIFGIWSRSAGHTKHLPMSQQFHQTQGDVAIISANLAQTRSRFQPAPTRCSTPARRATSDKKHEINPAARLSK